MDKPTDDHCMMLRLQDDEVRTWIDQEVIMLKATDGADPVELTPSTARTLTAHLIEMADRISE
jgi:hypothetical protein